MPITKVNAPDGSVISVNHPEGASEYDILSFASQSFQPKDKEAEVAEDVKEDVIDVDADIPEEDAVNLVNMYRQASSVLQEFNRGIADSFQLLADTSKGIGEKLGSDVPMPGGYPAAGGSSFLQLVTGPDEISEQLRDPEYKRQEELPR